MKTTAKTWLCTCNKCHHKWSARKNTPPILCPACKSLRWDK